MRGYLCRLCGEEQERDEWAGEKLRRVWKDEEVRYSLRCDCKVRRF